MSNSKIHIDQLFSKGLKDLEIPIVSSDFESIKRGITTQSEFETTIVKKPFEDYELAVTDADWQVIKDRLAKEKRDIIDLIPVGYAKESFKDFEIAVTDADWQATKSKLNNFKKKKIIWWWWLNIAIIGSLISLATYYFISFKQSSSTTSQHIALESKTDKNKIVISNETKLSKEKNNPSTENDVNKINNHSSINRIDEVSESNQSLTFSNLSESLAQTKKRKINTNSHSKYKKTPDADSKKENVKINDQTNGALLEIENTNKGELKTSTVENVTPTDLPNADETSSKVVVTKEVANSELNNTAKDEPLNPVTMPTDTSKKVDITSTAAINVPLPKPQLIFYFGLTSDIARTSRSLSKDNSASYNTIRNNAEKPITQFSYGVTFGIQKAKNQLQTGFQLTEQNFVSNYNYTLTYRDSIPVYDPNGNLIGKFPIGPLKEKNINESNHVTIKKIDIPFMYNRFWKLDTKTKLITGLGGVLCFNIKEEGTKTLNPANNQLYTYSYLKGSEKKYGLSPNINLGIQRKLDSHLELQFNTFFKYSITNRYDTSFSAKEYPYSQDASSFSAKEYLYSYGLSIKLLYLLH